MVNSVLFTVAALLPSALTNLLTCPLGHQAPLSCHNTTAIKNTCCAEVQGQVLQVQFWETDVRFT